jgi:triphosphoribosyl-dephospho-CoA synthase
MIRMRHLPAARTDGAAVAVLAVDCLKREVATHPKPGLVSQVDSGAHDDMDAALMNRSADTLVPFFAELAEAGASGCDMNRLRVIGIEAERTMLAATDGINTHRGAIFGLGLLCAAAGFRTAYRVRGSLGAIVAARWGRQILAGPVALRSHGTVIARRYGVGGARMEASRGFPSVYRCGLAALEAGRALAPGDEEAARVQLCMALIAAVEDTNLLHRGGPDGLAFARKVAQRFLAAGGVSDPAWRDRAGEIHRDFVARRLSPGGCADLLAMTLFVDRMERP